MKKETLAPSLTKRCAAFSVSAFFVMSKIVTAAFKTDFAHAKNLPLGVILLACRTAGVMSTSAKGNYDEMVASDQPKKGVKPERVRLPSGDFLRTSPLLKDEDNLKEALSLFESHVKDEEEEEVTISPINSAGLYPFNLCIKEKGVGGKTEVTISSLMEFSTFFESRYYYRLLIENLVWPVSVINALIQSSMSGYASYLVISAASVAAPWAMAIAGGIFTITMLIAMYFGGSSIKNAFRVFGQYLDSKEKSSFNLVSVGKFLFALCALSAVPLSYISMHTPLVALLLTLGMAASVCNPLSVIVCAALLVVSVIAAIGINYSQGSKLKAAFSRLGEKFNKMIGFRQQLAFVLSFLIASGICGATITIAVMGDVLGLKGVFDLSIVPVMLFALTSFICNVAFTLSDTLLRVTMSLTYVVSLGAYQPPPADESDDSGDEAVTKVSDNQYAFFPKSTGEPASETDALMTEPEACEVEKPAPR